MTRAGLLLLGIGALLWGCRTSRNPVAAAGAPLGVDITRGPAERRALRTEGLAAKLSPGYRRYLARLYERRKARGLPLPAELRIAARRGRYADLFQLLREAGKTARRVIHHPVLRRIPFVNPWAVARKNAITFRVQPGTVNPGALFAPPSRGRLERSSVRRSGSGPFRRSAGVPPPARRTVSPP